MFIYLFIFFFLLASLLPLEADLERLVRDEDLAIKMRNGVVSLFHGSHVHEAKALADVVHVVHDTGTSDSTVRAEEILKSALVHLVGDVVDEDADTIKRNRRRRERGDHARRVTGAVIHKTGVAAVVAVIVLGAFHSKRASSRERFDDSATKGFNSLTSSTLGVKLDEAEALAHASGTVERDIALDDGAEPGELCHEVLLLDGVEEVSDVKVNLNLWRLGNGNGYP